MVGEFRASATVVEVAGAVWAKRFSSDIRSDQKIEWEVRIPKNYSAESLPGVMVYISPGKSGKVPRQWKQVLDKRNLIRIAANHSGNRIDPRLRISYAILAPIFLGKDYKFDRNRVYVSGLSGGGRVASIVAPQYGSLFKGAIYICGVNDMDGVSKTTKTLLKTNRFVFLTGDKDVSRSETKRRFNAYRRKGFDNSLYLQIRGMGHENPKAAGFERAVKFLDGVGF